MKYEIHSFDQNGEQIDFEVEIEENLTHEELIEIFEKERDIFLEIPMGSTKSSEINIWYEEKG